MKSFYLTEAGKVRDHNEDSVIIVKNKSVSWIKRDFYLSLPYADSYFFIGHIFVFCPIPC